MKMQAILSAFWGVGLLLALNGARVVSARHNWHGPQTVFAFGDSFVDNGNVPSSEYWYPDGRQWFYPFGISSDEGTATGRFSDYMVETDFIAKMLGLPLSPPAFQSTWPAGYVSPSGMNFGFGSTGVFSISSYANLRQQVDSFKTLIKSGNISKNHVTHNSVALVGSSVNDYKHFGVRRSSRENTDFIAAVTTEIATNVERLRNLGVKRILVNNLHPFGCTPALSRPHGYKLCDHFSNQDAAEHNRNLEIKLGNKKGVLIVDLHTAFDNILAEDSESSLFKQKREPCCEAIDPNGFCGQQGDNSEYLYTLCANPSEFFFWDDAHPTHAGWEAIMTQLQDPIKEFLGIV